MAACLLTKNPDVKKQLDEYSDILGSKSAAYYVLSENNGYDLEYDSTGQPSALFSALLSHFNGDRNAAILAMASTFSDQFRDSRKIDEDSVNLPITVDDVINFNKPTPDNSHKTFTPSNIGQDRSFRHMAQVLQVLFPEIMVNWHADLNDGELGNIDTRDLDAIIMMISDEADPDTLPHEYAHRYIEMYRHLPIVQKAIEKFGSEEALVQAIGKQAVEQKGEAWGFWKKLWEHVKAVFSKNPYMTRALQIDLTNAFLQRKDLAKNSKFGQKIVTKGQMYFQKKATTSVGEIRQILQTVSNQIQFDESTHTYTHDGKRLKSVSEWKSELLYSAYDDSDITENQRQYNDDSRVIGTTIHEVLESLFKGTYVRERFTKPIYNTTTGSLKQVGLSKKALDGLEQIYNAISEKYEWVASEAMMGDFDAGVAGTTDLILRNKKTGKIGIFDYKTKCIEMNGLKTNKDGKKLWGFSYVNKSRNGAKSTVNAYDFQLTAYQYMLKKLGIPVEDRGIIPIVYKLNTKTNIVTDAYFTKYMGQQEIDPEEGVYPIAEQQAVQFDVYSRVFGQESDKYNTEYIEERTREFKRILDAIIKSLSNKALIDRKQGRRSQARQLDYVVDKLGNVSDIQAMMLYLKSAADQLSRVYKQIYRRQQAEGLKSNKDAVSWDLDSLREYRDLALAFNVVDDISSFVQSYADLLTKEEKEAIQSGINEVSALQRNILNAYKRVGIRLYMQALQPYVGNIRARYKEQYEREYRASHKNVNKADMDAYVQKKLNENSAQIEQETSDWLRNQMNVADNIFECSTVASYIGTVFQSKDPFVQASVKYFDERMQEADHEYILWQRALLKLVNEYEEKYGVGNLSNHRKAYDDLIEIIDGQAYLVGEIPNAFREAYVKFRHELNEDTSLTYSQRQDKLQEWFDKNAPIVDQKGFEADFLNSVKEIVKDVKNDKHRQELINNVTIDNEKKKKWYFYYKKGWITLQQLDSINEAYSDLQQQYRRPNPSIYANKKYQNLMELAKTDDVKYRLWKFLSDAVKRGDEHVDLNRRLDNRLPGVRKTAVERVSEDGVLKGGKDSVINYAKESSILVEDDATQGQAFTDMNGNVVNQIPIHFNGRLSLNDQSFDLPTIFARWYKSAMEYHAKREMEEYLLMTAEILKNRSTRSGKRSILGKIKGTDEEAIVKSDNTYKQFVAWLDQVFYGNTIRTTTETVGRVSPDKVLKTFMKYYSFRVMGFNYISMINNFSVGALNQLIEAFGRDVIDMKSFGKGIALYSKHIVAGTMIADVGRRAPEDFVNRLVEWFGILNPGKASLRASGLQRLATTDVAYWTTNVGEHMNQATFLLSALYKLQAKDEKGNVLGDMIDFLSFDENGSLVVDPKVANFDNKRQAEFGMGVRSVLMSMHGNYASRFAVALQQYMVGKMVLMFRKWIYTGFKRRFSKRYYDNIRGMFVEGYHTTLLRVGSGIFINPAIRKFADIMGIKIDQTKMQVLKWNQLSDEEKHNVYRSIAEIGIIATCYALSSLFRGLAGDDDDDDSTLWWNISYQFYRAYTDLSFNFNPFAMMRVIQDPVPAMSSLDNFAKLFERAFSPTEVYTTGSRAGQNKFLYSLGEVSPIVGQVNRWRDIQEEFAFLEAQG